MGHLLDLHIHMKNKIVNNSVWWDVGLCPCVLALVSRWNNLLEEMAEQLHSSKALLQLWQRYKDYSKQCASAVQQQEARAKELLKAATSKDIADDEVATWIQDCNVCSGKIVPSRHVSLRRLTLSRALPAVCELWLWLHARRLYQSNCFKDPRGFELFRTQLHMCQV